MAAHLCIEFELSEGVAVAAGGLEEPVADWLVHQVLGSAAAHQDDAVGVAFGNGSVLAESTRLHRATEDETKMIIRDITGCEADF